MASHSAGSGSGMARGTASVSGGSGTLADAFAPNIIECAPSATSNVVIATADAVPPMEAPKLSPASSVVFPSSTVSGAEAAAARASSQPRFSSCSPSLY